MDEGFKKVVEVSAAAAETVSREVEQEGLGEEVCVTEEREVPVTRLVAKCCSCLCACVKRWMYVLA